MGKNFPKDFITMEIKEIDYRRFDLMNETLNNYYKAMLETVDTADYVPPRKFKKINDLIFKEYKYTVKQVKKNYKAVYRYERNQALKAKLTALKDKIKSKFHKKTKAGQ